MYVAEENCVYYCKPHGERTRELFLTIHPVEDCAKTTRQQAATLVHMLNSDASLRYLIAYKT